MDLRQIQYFTALYEERSITRAAKRLHVVQPAVSMQIRKLEMDYGVQLFDRTAQGVMPNALAEQLYPLCQKVLGDLSAARRFLKEAKGKVTGSLSLGVPPSVAQGCLADVVAEFHALYPEVRLAIYEGYTGHLVEWLTDGLLELAILHAAESDKRLQLAPLLTEDLVAVMSVESAGERSEIAGAALGGLQLALPSGQNMTRLLMEASFAREGLALEPAVELDSLAAVLNLVRHPGWASLLPSSAVGPRVLGEDLRRLRLVEPSISRTLVVATLLGTETSHAAQLFVGQLDLALKLNAAGSAAHQPT
jgi:DNA-binding transcriptional LysR family regulator